MLTGAPPLTYSTNLVVLQDELRPLTAVVNPAFLARDLDDLFSIVVLVSRIPVECTPSILKTYNPLPNGLQFVTVLPLVVIRWPNAHLYDSRQEEKRKKVA